MWGQFQFIVALYVLDMNLILNEAFKESDAFKLSKKVVIILICLWCAMIVDRFVHSFLIIWVLDYLNSGWKRLFNITLILPTSHRVSHLNITILVLS